MKYAKLIEGAIRCAPNPIVVDDRQIGNPPAEVYLEQGYKAVVYTEPPEIEPGYIAVPGWEEEAEAIVQTWTVEEEPISEEDALVRYANEITGASDETLTDATETLIKKVMEV